MKPPIRIDRWVNTPAMSYAPETPPTLEDVVRWLRWVEESQTNIMRKESGVFGVGRAEGQRNLAREVILRLGMIEGG